MDDLNLSDPEVLNRVILALLEQGAEKVEIGFTYGGPKIKPLPKPGRYLIFRIEEEARAVLAPITDEEVEAATETFQVAFDPTTQEQFDVAIRTALEAFLIHRFGETEE